MALTGKQEAFKNYYCGECKQNATEAAARAGYKGSRETLAVVAAENLRKPKIKQAILAKMAEISEKIDVTTEEIILELRQIAFDERPVLIRADMTNRLKALELLGRYKAMFTDNVSQKGEGLTINVSSESDEPQIRPIRAQEAG